MTLGAESSRSWWTLGQSISREFRDTEPFQFPLESTADAEAFGAAIVSETATEVACEKAYKDVHGSYFDKNRDTNIVTKNYVYRSIGVMKVQFMRAAVRLARMLDIAATEYYSALRLAAPAQEPLAGSANSFAGLEVMSTLRTPMSSRLLPQSLLFDNHLSGAPELTVRQWFS